MIPPEIEPIVAALETAMNDHPDGHLIRGLVEATYEYDMSDRAVTEARSRFTTARLNLESWERGDRAGDPPPIGPAAAAIDLAVLHRRGLHQALLETTAGFSDSEFRQYMAAAVIHLIR